MRRAGFLLPVQQPLIRRARIMASSAQGLAAGRGMDLPAPPRRADEPPETLRENQTVPGEEARCAHGHKEILYFDIRLHVQLFVNKQRHVASQQGRPPGSYNLASDGRTMLKLQAAHLLDSSTWTNSEWRLFTQSKRNLGRSSPSVYALGRCSIEYAAVARTKR